MTCDQPYTTLRIEEDTARRIHWCFMHRDHDARHGRRCFSPAMLEDLLSWQRTFTARFRTEQSIETSVEVPHVVFASDTDVFNLGGDLEYFCRMIREQNRDGLFAYARDCVELVHTFHSGFGVGAYTISLVQGEALGGGFEAALAGRSVVAEMGIRMGFPEVLFDLFPGMGAYPLLCERVSSRVAEKLILGGDIHSSDSLHEMGLVDVLVPKGGGRLAVEELIRANRRRPHAQAAMHRVRELFQPVPFAEMMRITEIWVETAMRLGEKPLAMMERLVHAQVKLGQRVALL